MLLVDESADVEVEGDAGGLTGAVDAALLLADMPVERFAFVEVALDLLAQVFDALYMLLVLAEDQFRCYELAADGGVTCGSGFGVLQVAADQEVAAADLRVLDIAGDDEIAIDANAAGIARRTVDRACDQDGLIARYGSAAGQVGG